MARLGDILVKKGWVTEGQIQSALTAQGSERGLLGTILIRRGLIDVDQLGEALSEQYSVPYEEIIPESIRPQVVRLIPEELARSREIVPLSVSNSTMKLAMTAPDDRWPVAARIHATLAASASEAPAICRPRADLHPLLLHGQR